MKHVLRKLFIFIQTLGLSLSLFSFPVYAQGNTAVTSSKYNGYDVIQGTAQFPSGDSGITDDISTTFYYSDGYFKDPETYNSSLATMSMCMALAAMNANAGGTSDYTNKSAHIKQLLSDIGCDEEDIYINQAYKEKPTKDTIGVAIASKKLSNSDSILIPIAVRGGNYELEWVSNVTLGLSGQAEGFSTAADKVFAEVQNYITEHNLTEKVNAGKVKFWIAGYSRAGAVSNLVSKLLIDNYSGNEVYGYTFEAPQGGLSDQNDQTKYASIHNIINDADLVPLVAPTLMGFGRYGVTHAIGTNASNYRKSMETQLKQINSQSFSGTVTLPEESFSLAHYWLGIKNFDSSVKMSEWLVNFMNHIQTYTMDEGKYREEYVNGYGGHGSIQEALQLVMNEMHGGSEAEAKSKLDAIVIKIIKYIESFNTKASQLNGVEENPNSDSIKNLQATMDKEFNTLFSDSELNTSNSATGALSNLLFWFVYSDYWNTQYGTSYGLIDACTFAYNYKTIMVNHYPEINLAWLRSEDSMYTNETIDSIVVPDNNNSSSSSKKTIVIHSKTVSGNWLVSNGRWWYRHTDGSYTTNSFETINGQVYYFDASGYMVTGWQSVNGTWYYFTDSGAMYKGWAYLSDTWYYMNADGKMLTGFYDVNGQTYYSDASGAMCTGWILVNNTYYYAYASGAIAKNAWINGYYVDASGKWISSMPKGEWKRNSVGWWYRHGDGSYAVSSFEDINGKTYYFDEDGYMAAGWRYINGYWYFFEASGAMVTGWYKVNGTWYYSYSNGRMATDTTIQGFTVNHDGAWVN